MHLYEEFHPSVYRVYFAYVALFYNGKGPRSINPEHLLCIQSALEHFSEDEVVHALRYYKFMAFRNFEKFLKPDDLIRMKSPCYLLKPYRIEKFKNLKITPKKYGKKVIKK